MGILADARSFLLRRRQFLQLLISGATSFLFQSSSVKANLFTPKPTRLRLLMQEARVEERQTVIQNLKAIAHALHRYHDCHGRFPPAALYSTDGRPLLSWRVLLLPFLRGSDLYERFKLDEPWDSPRNKPLLGEMPSVYASSGRCMTERFQTRYQVITGAGTLFARKDGPMLSEICDGTGYTLLVVEAGVVPWTKPQDIAYTEDQPLPRLGGLFSEGFYAALAQGTVHFIKKETEEETLRSLITPRDGRCIFWDPESTMVYPRPNAPSLMASKALG